ncbi:MAG: ferritin-like domain-containing protein [Desulfitobacteriaceae bacterium]
MSTPQQIEALNELLKGEHMAIDIYVKTNGLQKDIQVAEMLSDFENDHKQHAELLIKRINDLGGIPKGSTGLAGAMANLVATVNSYRGPEQLLKQLYDGEDKGIHAYEVRIDELDSVSQNLVKQIVLEDQEHCKQFKSRMEQEKREGHVGISEPH